MTQDWKQPRSTDHGTATHGSLAASLVVVLGICVSVAWPTRAVASQALAQKYACVACHQPTAKAVGPSWKDIGARYGEGKGTAAQLAASIKAGSSGKWGAMPMPAQAQIPDADLQSLAQWALDGAK
ncbi:c-type cytochrome [Variovorax sp. LjRoot84]|uniref:c-type cytochrome n=1 Tax=Variovorax sp. LjRoot84 TaxID=3342340 RepID=UPI003ECC4CD2